MAGYVCFTSVQPNRTGLSPAPTVDGSQIFLPGVELTAWQS